MANCLLTKILSEQGEAWLVPSELQQAPVYLLGFELTYVPAPRIQKDGSNQAIVSFGMLKQPGNQAKSRNPKKVAE